MNAVDAKIILEMLLDGVDPVTGETLGVGHVCARPEVIRALHAAIVALGEKGRRNGRNEKNARRRRAENEAKGWAEADSEGARGLENRGKPWSEEDDARLAELFRQGVSVKEIAGRFKRTQGAIDARLVKLGLVEL